MEKSGDHHTSLEIPANTPADNPVQREITVKGEILDEIAYIVPRGCKNLVHWAVFYGIKQIYPQRGGEWVGVEVPYRAVKVNWRMPETTISLAVKGYNEDDTYSHTVYLWLLTKPEEEARPWKIMADFIAILKRLIGL